MCSSFHKEEEEEGRSPMAGMLNENRTQKIPYTMYIFVDVPI